jgi:4-diphosphocytidyl-2-C-methyl-D-erythritol kinase
LLERAKALLDMKLFPNCKINIGLRVVRKREDGYHDLETIFYPVYGLHDELEVEEVNDIENQGYTFIQEGLAVDCHTEDNLIIKCYL